VDLRWLPVLDSNLLLPLVEREEKGHLQPDGSDTGDEDAENGPESFVVERFLVDGEEQRADDVSLRENITRRSARMFFPHEAMASIKRLRIA